MDAISSPKSSVSMLVVEDDKGSKDLLVTVISKKFPGLTIHVAINGKTGLERFKEHTPDIVVTDINMPEMNGVQMIDKIKAIKPNAKIIVLTADTGKTALEDTERKGLEIDHYLMKPVDFGELFSAIEQCRSEIALRRS